MITKSPERIGFVANEQPAPVDLSIESPAMNRRVDPAMIASLTRSVVVTIERLETEVRSTESTATSEGDTAADECLDDEQSAVANDQMAVDTLTSESHTSDGEVDTITLQSDVVENEPLAESNDSVLIPIKIRDILDCEFVPSKRKDKTVLYCHQDRQRYKKNKRYALYDGYVCCVKGCPGRIHRNIATGECVCANNIHSHSTTGEKLVQQHGFLNDLKLACADLNSIGPLPSVRDVFLAKVQEYV